MLGTAGTFAGTRTVLPAGSSQGGEGSAAGGAAHAAGGTLAGASAGAAHQVGRGGGEAAGIVSEASTREALDFFFSREGRPFREFLLEEVSRSVDTLSRDAIAQIGYRVGLQGRQMPPFLRALAPPVTDKDRKVRCFAAGRRARRAGVGMARAAACWMRPCSRPCMPGARAGPRGQPPPIVLRTHLARANPLTQVVENISRLIEFLLGDFNSAAPTAGSAANRNRQLAQLQALIPVLREYAPSMREFGLLLVTRLTEKQASRAFEWAKQQIEQTSVA